MNLHYLEIKIRPSYFTDHKEIEIIVRTNVKEYHLTESFPDSNDFESRFDWLMKRAIHEIKENIKST